MNALLVSRNRREVLLEFIGNNYLLLMELSYSDKEQREKNNNGGETELYHNLWLC